MVLKNKWFKLVNNSTYPLRENVSCSATLLPRIRRALYQMNSSAEWPFIAQTSDHKWRVKTHTHTHYLRSYMDIYWTIITKDILLQISIYNIITNQKSLLTLYHRLYVKRKTTKSKHSCSLCSWSEGSDNELGASLYRRFAFFKFY